MSIESFRNKGTLEIYQGSNTKRARQLLPVELHDKARRMMDRLDKAEGIREVEATPGYQLKRLSGDREDQVSIRISDQYRICFFWVDGDAHAVEIVDYHE